ncbi:Phospholipase/carboxylesterase/thioesterase [Astrocystis sublimbata]|nr:Phospholipase/carboxylesterase/thioesterase [Astrocystis sublimbata]
MILGPNYSHSASFARKPFYCFIFSTLLAAFYLSFCSAEPIIADPPTKMASMARPLLFNASAKHTATVIFLHGLGDTGAGWAPAVEGWVRTKKFDEVKWVLPNAPAVPITAAGGMPMPGWFDINALNGRIDDFRNNQDEPGLLKTRDYVNGLIQDEIDAGIPANRIIVGGFSQGGAMALLTGLTAKVKLGGVVGLSCWLPIDKRFEALVKDSHNNNDTPVLMAHGTADTVVPEALGDLSYEVLKKMDFSVTMKKYPGMAHAACQEEMNEVERFVQARLPPQEKKSEL